MPSEDTIPLPGPMLDLNNFNPEFLPSVDIHMDENMFSKEENLLEEFNNVFDTFLPNNDSFDTKMNFDTSLFDSLMQVDDNSTQWPDVFPQLSDLHTNGADYSIKTECETPAGSPRSVSSSSDSSNSSDVRFTLETPPISPPRTEPIQTAEVLQPTITLPDKKSPILKINPNNIKIIPCAANLKGLKPLGKQRHIVLPKEILEKVEKIKKESELSSSSPIDVTVSSSPQIVYKSPIPVVSNEAKNITSNITVIPNNTKIIRVDTTTRPLTFLQSAQPIPCVKQEIQDVRKDEFTLKALKKQQRMIKNRESACLSRKKKKEYMMNLEGKLRDLEQENRKLKMENELLKNRLKEVEISGSSNTNKNQNVFNNIKKSTAVLAVLLMVSLNIGSLSLIKKDSLNEFKIRSDGMANEGIKHHGRSLLWAESEVKETVINGSTKPPMCPLFVNQSESLRLEKELRRWIAVDRKQVSDKNTSAKFAFQKPTLRQLILHTPPYKPWRTHKMQKKLDSAVDLYRAPFPGSIPRKSDTFYVVSFSSDHLLLPAIAHNITARPKMSLLLPTVPVGDSLSPNGTVPMMQIDCEVLATRSVLLTGNDIKMLRQKKQPAKGNSTDQVAVKEPPYRPYFVRSSKSSSSSEFDQNFDAYMNRVYRAANPFP